MRRRKLLALALAGTMILAACADDETSTSDDSTTTTSASGGTDSTNEPTGELGQGVTDDSIKLGVAFVDYTCAVSDYVDFVRGDQQETAQILIDDINADGGVGGRQIEPVYKEYCPVPGVEPSANTLCTQFAQDEQVFAVVGSFIDITGQAHKCLSGDNEVITISHELQEAWLDDAGGLLLTPNSTPDNRAIQLITALSQEGMLDGRTVAVLADQDGQDRADDVIVPALEESGVELGTTGILTLGTTDTSAAQSQMDGFIQRWQTEGVDTVLMSGLQVSDKQFVQKLKQQMPDVQLLADSDTTASQAQDLNSQGVSPNPYEGMISVAGGTAAERWADKPPLLEECVATWEEATGETIKAPGEEDKTADGETIEINSSVTDHCGVLSMFRQIAERAGATLNNDTWVETVNSFGSFELPQGTMMSLCEGKYAADDAAQLLEFDSSLGVDGDWETISDVVDGDDTCG